MAWLGIVAIRVYDAQPVASITAQLASHTRTETCHTVRLGCVACAYIFSGHAATLSIHRANLPDLAVTDDKPKLLNQ